MGEAVAVAVAEGQELYPRLAAADVVVASVPVLALVLVLVLDIDLCIQHLDLAVEIAAKFATVAEEEMEQGPALERLHTGEEVEHEADAVDHMLEVEFVAGEEELIHIWTVLRN